MSSDQTRHQDATLDALSTSPVSYTILAIAMTQEHLSTVRWWRIVDDVTIFYALPTRYQEEEQGHDKHGMYIETASQRKVGVELVGEDRVRDQQACLDIATQATLTGAQIARVVRTAETRLSTPYFIGDGWALDMCKTSPGSAYQGLHRHHIQPLSQWFP